MKALTLVILVPFSLQEYEPFYLFMAEMRKGNHRGWVVLQQFLA